MRKVIKHYVEISKDIFWGFDTSFKEVESRNPLELDIKEDAVAIRFFDIECIVDDGRTYHGKKFNYSNTIFFGERFSIEDVIDKYGKNLAYSTIIQYLKSLNIKSVCVTRNKQLFPMKNGDITYDEYVTNKNSNQENVCMDMFNKLKEHIGDRVYYELWDGGILKTGVCKLTGVWNFTGIKLDTIIFPFVGYSCAILKISSKDGEILYSNSYIEDCYNRRTPNSIFEAQRMIYGDKIVDNKEEKLKKNKEDRKKVQEELRKVRLTYIEEGSNLVIPELKKEWKKFVDMTCDNYYSASVAETIISMIKKFNEGISFDEAEKQSYESLNEYLKNSTIKALIRFAPQGIEYKKYLDEKYSADESKEMQPELLKK